MQVKNILQNLKDFIKCKFTSQCCIKESLEGRANVYDGKHVVAPSGSEPHICTNVYDGIRTR
jgi:hypothetical protein